MLEKEISIIIPAPKNEDISKTIESIKQLKYPVEKIELIVARGNQPPVQRNLAVKKAIGKILYFIDSDVLLEKENLNNLKKSLDFEKSSLVGGPVLQVETGFLQRTFGKIFSSAFAMGSTKSRFSKNGKKRIASEEDLILANLAVKKSVFDELNGFNENLYPNEENEFMNRLVSKGYSMEYNPEIIVYRVHKKNFLQFAKAFFSYGRGRAEHFSQNPKFFKPFFIIPSAFLVYLFSLLFFRQFFYILPLLFYFFIDLFFSIFSSLNGSKNFIESILMIPLLLLLFPTVHLTYGAGFLHGCTKMALRIRSQKNVIVEIEKVNV